MDSDDTEQVSSAPSPLLPYLDGIREPHQWGLQSVQWQMVLFRNRFRTIWTSTLLDKGLLLKDSRLADQCCPWLHQ